MTIQARNPICAFGFEIGNTVEIDDEECRIGCQNKDGSVTFISYRTGRHFDLTRDEFMEKVSSGKVVVNGPSSSRQRRGISLLEAMLNRTASGTSYFDVSAYRAEFVRALIAVPRGKRTAELVDGLLSRVHREYLEKWRFPSWLIEKSPPSRSTAYRWLKAAEKRANADLLVPAFHLRGTRGGRSHPLIEEKIEELIETIYFRDPEAKISSSATSIHKEIESWLTEQPRLTGCTAPSPGKIRDRIALHGGERRLEHEEGKRVAQLNYKAVMLGPDLLFPMARWEIDHTKIDINVVDNDGNYVIGRVWLTCIIDHKTRMIAGYLLDAQAPDASSVLAALRFAMMPKTRAQLDALGVKSGWPVAGVPTELATDRGKDFLSRSVSRALRALGIDLVMMPPRTPQSKGRIERFFGTLNTLLFHQLAGTTKSNTAAKGDRKPEQEARITFAELNSLIARIICDVYHIKRHSALRCSPFQAWNQLTEKYPVSSLKSASEIRNATMMSYDGIATRSGIRVEGIQYNSPDVARLRSHAHAHVRGNPEVHVLLDPEDISKIHFRDPQSGQVVEVPALEAPKLKGVSLRMHRFIQAELDMFNREDTPSNYAKHLAELTAEYRQINRRRRKPIRASSTTVEAAQPGVVPAYPLDQALANTTAPKKARKISPVAKDATPQPLPKLNKTNLND